jgi:small subunit ribosomal protein S4
MGDPKFPRRLYKTPTHPWNGPRILEEHQMVSKYGLKNKHELWRSKTMLSDLRAQARELQARLRSEDEQARKENDAMIERLKRMGLLHGTPTLNDVLILDLEDILARRLQTQIYLKGLARTMKQARQFIVHGHIAINGRKITVPGYLVPDSEMANIAYFPGSGIANELHPERPAKDFVPQLTTVKDEMAAAAVRERETKRMRDGDRVRAVARKLAPEGVSKADVDLVTVAAAGEATAELPELPEEPAEEGAEDVKAAAAPATGVKAPAPAVAAAPAAAPAPAPHEGKAPARGPKEARSGDKPPKAEKKPKGGEA